VHSRFLAVSPSFDAARGEKTRPDSGFIELEPATPPVPPMARVGYPLRSSFGPPSHE
jgi:hypothetical protein